MNFWYYCFVISQLSILDAKIDFEKEWRREPKMFEDDLRKIKKEEKSLRCELADNVISNHFQKLWFYCSLGRKKRRVFLAYYNC